MKSFLWIASKADNRALILPGHFLLILLFLLLLGGCAQLKKDLKDGFVHFSDELKRYSLEDRDEAIKKFNYSGKETELIMDSLSINPYTVHPGDQLRQELRYAILSPESGRSFQIVEKVMLTGKNGKKIDLLTNVTEKNQGVHSLDFRIIIPMDIESGEYQIVNTLSTATLSRTAKGYFSVVK